MKSPVIVCLAGLVVASLESPAPSPDVLLSWRQPSKAHHRCGGPVGYLDILCGTRQYCSAVDTAFERTDWRFNSSQQCFDAHEEEPLGQAAESPPAEILAWVDQGTNERQCGPGPWPITDKRCGTQRYCESIDTIALARTDQQFVTTQDCFDAHEPNPHAGQPEPKLDWMEPQDPDKWCGIFQYLEEQCGTSRYCWAFDNDREFTDGKFSSTAACIDAHHPSSSNPVPMTTKFGWKHATPEAYRCDKDGFWHLPICGTAIYCDAFDKYLNQTDGRFKTAAECRDAFELPEQ